MHRGKSVPGGACGFWGACGAAISSGMFISIITKSTPLAQEPWGLSNLMTSKSLGAIGKIGGPRCCKRDSYLSLLSAIDFAKEHFGVEMERPEIVCHFSARNNQCIGKRCPFSVANHWRKNGCLSVLFDSSEVASRLGSFFLIFTEISAGLGQWCRPWNVSN